MDILEFLFELGPVFVRVLAEYRYISFVFAGRNHLEVDTMLIQHPVEVRQLGDHTDRAEYCERSCDEPVGDTCHQVSAARGHFVHRNEQGNALIANAHELRGSEAVLVDDTAMILQADNDLIIRPGHFENGAYLFAE